eukprot:scaffold140284_cov40-Cyclotella_meneghiniana.AAC.1
MPSQAFNDIEALCYSDEPESELLPQLAAIISEHPNVGGETDDIGWSPLHCAALHRSPEFCNLIIELNSDLVKKKTNIGELPFHESCIKRNVETAKYLFSLYPVSIHIANTDGFYPLHIFVDVPWLDTSESDDMELLKFLLKHDRGAISSATVRGELPLHLACQSNVCINIIKLVYDSYPEAIHVNHNPNHSSVAEEIMTPLDMARGRGKAEAVAFFELQLNNVRQA